MGSAAAISATELAFAAAGNPIIAASQAIIAARWTTDGLATGTDISAASYPARRSLDGHMHPITQPTGTPSGSTIYLNFTLDTTKAFDVIMIAGHNAPIFFTDPEGLNLEVQVSDEADFSPSSTVHIFTKPQSYRRLLALTTQRYTGYAYARIVFWLSAGTFSGWPVVSEVLLSRRRQFERRPMRPYDEYEESGEFAEFRSKSATLSSFERFSGQRLVRATFRPHRASEIETIRAWWADCRGKRPSLWIERPSDASPYAFLCGSPPGLSMPVQQGMATERELRLELDEIAPFAVNEEA